MLVQVENHLSYELQQILFPYYRVFFIDWNIVSGTQITIFPSKFVFRGIFTSQTSYFVLTSSLFRHVKHDIFQKVTFKNCPFTKAKNRKFQYLSLSDSNFFYPIFANFGLMACFTSKSLSNFYGKKDWNFGIGWSHLLRGNIQY